MRIFLKEIDEVCKNIELAWKKFDNAYEVFPNIVMEHTNNLDLSSLSDLSNILELLNDPYIALLNPPNSFSDNHLNLWDNGRFLIEVLNWHGSDINIHDHNFSGVQFQIKGKSLNVIYDFDSRVHTSKINEGKLAVRSAEVWHPGNRSIVRPGDKDPHTVYHLENPTVSLLFRTAPTSDFGPQLNYFPPSLRCSYGVADNVFRKRLQTLSLISVVNQKKFHESFRLLTSKQSPSENLYLILKMNETLFLPENIAILEEFSSESSLNETIIKTAAYRRALEFLEKHIKSIDDLNLDEVLAISIIAASFDQISLSKIIKHIENTEPTFDFINTFQSLHNKLPQEIRCRFSKTICFFGQDEILDISNEFIQC